MMREALETRRRTAQNPAMNKLRALILFLASALLASGCWGGDTASGPAPQQSVTSRFIAGTPSRIETVIIDPLPVEAARLILPDGTTIVAQEVVRERNTYADQGDSLPHVAVGAAGGSQTRVTTGIGIEFPLFGGGGGGTHNASLTTSSISFRVPDIEIYRRDWQHWILHVDLGEGANHRTIETLPPKPPR
jgi:hypothetical protein